jgi:hypothetical protein
MKSLTFKKLANHWYPEIPHDSLDDIKLSEKVEKCYDLVVLERYQCKIELAEMKEMIDEMLKNI